MWHRRQWHNRQWTSTQWRTTCGLAAADTGDEPAYVDLFSGCDTMLDDVFAERVTFQRLGQSNLSVTASLMTENDDWPEDQDQPARASVRTTWLMSTSDLSGVVPRAGDRFISAGRQYEVLPERTVPASLEMSRRGKILVRAKRVT